MSRVYMVFDYETFSECNLKQSGGFEYSKHPSTEIMCAAFRLGTRDRLAAAPTHLVVPGADDPSVEWFHECLADPEIHLVAHNALFEQFITEHVYRRDRTLPKIPLSRWHCTAAMARSIGLPGALDQVCKALELENQKSSAGHQTMLKLAKPRKPTKNNSATRHREPDDLKKLYDYCKADIAAEVELFLRLPPLPKRERLFWTYDQRINRRGFAVDRELIGGALQLIDSETETLDSTMLALTNGAVKSARQGAATLSYLKDQGLLLPNLKADTVETFLRYPSLDDHCRQILEIRSGASKSSTTKYLAFDVGSRVDGRLRDTLLFYGAHTGRGAGRRVQPQNLPKPYIAGVPTKEVQKEIEMMLPLIAGRDATTIQALYDKPMELYSSALRSCIVAPTGRTLDVGDFSTIEVRVLFWLAGYQKGLEAFGPGKDIYCDMASVIYGIPAEEILDAHKAKDSERRQLGKATVLGAGFGMGVGGEKFQATTRLPPYNLEISLSMAQTCIRAYREKHPKVPAFWRTIEQAAKSAMLNRGKAYRHGFLTWRLERDFLTCELPIGRKLFYFKPKLERKRTLYGESTVLSYLGADSKTKQFARQKTWGGKLAENVTQAVARDVLMDAVVLVEQTTSTAVVLTVHDEIVGERFKVDPETDSAAHAAFLRAMSTAPTWAEGLPVAVEGWAEERYRK